MDPKHSKKAQDAEVTEQLNQSLNKTELGRLLGSHYKWIVAGMVGLVLVLVLIPVINSQRAKSRQEIAAKVFDFKEQIKSFEEGKLKYEELSKQFSDFEANVGIKEETASVLISMAKVLANKEKEQEAVELLQGRGEEFSTNPYLSFFFNRLLATLHENLGNTDDAVQALEKINGASVKLAELKTNYDLGRLYAKQGKLDRAQEKFKLVTEKGKENDQLTKLAGLSLQELAKKETSK